MFNTEDLYDEVGQILLERRGHQFTRQLKLEMMGLPVKVAFEIMKRQCNLVEPIEVLQEETYSIFASMLPDRICTMPGLWELLKAIESLGLPKCVCTSSRKSFAKQALGMFELEHRFRFVLTSEDVDRGKPHPDVYLLAAKKFRIDPANMLVLEDSHNGSMAGASSGAYTVAVPTTHSRELDFSHAALQVESLQDTRIFDLLSYGRL